MTQLELQSEYSTPGTSKRQLYTSFDQSGVLDLDTPIYRGGNNYIEWVNQNNSAPPYHDKLPSIGILST